MRVKHDSSACTYSRKQGGTADYDSVPFHGMGSFFDATKSYKQ